MNSLLTNYADSSPGSPRTSPVLLHKPFSEMDEVIPDRDHNQSPQLSVVFQPTTKTVIRNDRDCLFPQTESVGLPGTEMEYTKNSLPSGHYHSSLRVEEESGASDQTTTSTNSGSGKTKREKGRVIKRRRHR